MQMYSLWFVIDLKTYLPSTCHNSRMVNAVLFSCQFDNKATHDKSFPNTEFSQQYLEIFFFLAISELALFQANNYMGLVTFLSSGYMNDLINRNNPFKMKFYRNRAIRVVKWDSCDAHLMYIMFGHSGAELSRTLFYCLFGFWWDAERDKDWETCCHRLPWGDNS